VFLLAFLPTGTKIYPELINQLYANRVLNVLQEHHLLLHPGSHYHVLRFSNSSDLP